MTAGFRKCGVGPADSVMADVAGVGAEQRGARLPLGRPRRVGVGGDVSEGRRQRRARGPRVDHRGGPAA